MAPLSPHEEGNHNPDPETAQNGHGPAPNPPAGHPEGAGESRGTDGPAAHSRPPMLPPPGAVSRPLTPAWQQVPGPEPAPYETLAAEDPAAGGLLEYYRMLQRRRGTVLLTAFLGLVAAVLFTLPRTPVYQARTVLEIQGINEDFMRLREVSPTESGSGAYAQYDIQTQARILQSRAMLERVVKKTGADRPLPAAPQSRIAVWRETLGLDAPPSPTFEDAVNAAASNLKVRAQPNTRLVEVTYDSTDPQRAAGFLNTLTEEFIEQNLEARWATTQHTSDWLARQLEEFKIKLEKSEESLQAYGRQTGLLFTQEKDNVTEQKLKQLQDELSRAQADRIAKQSRYELAPTAPVDSLGEVLDNQALKSLELRLADLRRQHAELSSAFTPKHPKVRNIQAQVAAVEASIERERANIVTRIHNDFESARRRENLLATDYAAHVKLISAQADKVAHYGILKREVDMNRQLYETMLQRLKEANIASALRASNIRVVDPAKPPRAPYKPSLALNALLGLMGGFFLGVAWVVFRERADRTIQEPGDMGAWLGLPELGVVPAAAVDATRRRKLIRRRSEDSGPRECLELVTLERRPSALSESFHATLTSILFSVQNGAHPRVLVVCSAGPQEGKTTICSNLAVALAAINNRVLVIDADIRRPRMHHIFGLENDKGLVDVLSRRASADLLNGDIQPTRVPNLSVLTSGASDSVGPRLLYSRRLPELITLLRRDYDMILIDTPPMLTMADARVVARHGDAVLLVARANQTSRDTLKDACQRFAEDGTVVLGTVLNGWNAKQSSRYGYYRYYDKYSHYYGDKARS